MWSRLKRKMAALPGSTGASVKKWADGAFLTIFLSMKPPSPCCPIFLFSVDLLKAHKIIDRGTKSKNISHALRLLPLLLIVVGEVQLTFGGSLKVINYCLRVNFGARVQWKIGKQSSQQPRTPRRNVWECINIYVQNQIQHHNPSAVLIYGEEKTMNNHQGMCCLNLFRHWSEQRADDANVTERVSCCTALRN